MNSLVLSRKDSLDNILNYVPSGSLAVGELLHCGIYRCGVEVDDRTRIYRADLFLHQGRARQGITMFYPSQAASKCSLNVLLSQEETRKA